MMNPIQSIITLFHLRLLSSELNDWLKYASTTEMTTFSAEKMVGPALFVTSFVYNFLLISKFGRTSAFSHKAASKVQPPLAKKIADKISFGYKADEDRGDNPMNPPKVRVDHYNWLRDETRKKKEVINHLLAENKYCEEMTANLKELQESLYQEILSHLKETDEEVPYKHGPYLYYGRTVQGLSYKIHCRKPFPATDTSTKEQVILDENKVAEGHEYSVVSDLESSPDHKLLAYTVDHDGYETYTVYIKNIDSDTMLPDILENSDGNIVWDRDSSRLYYMTMDDEHRPDKLWVHVLGTKQDQDVCLYEEKDPRFWMGISKTASGRYLVMGVESKETSEQHILDLSVPVSNRKLQVISPRIFGHRYDIEHLVVNDKPTNTNVCTDIYMGNKDQFLIVTNKDKAKNQKLVRISVDAIGDCNVWKDVKPYDESIQIDNILPFKSHIAIFGRMNGLEQIWLSTTTALNTWKPLRFSEEVHSVWCSDNYEYDSNILRLGYSSLVTPKTYYDYNMQTGDMNTLKVQEVPHYDSTQYISKRMYATATDSTRIPLSVVHHKKIDLSTKTPCPTILYGYGSYGVCIDPVFDYKRTALLDRGVIYVIAHIRGGGEMGRHWYEDQGKYLTKLNTFTDFGDCAQFLIQEKISSADQLGCVGRSAGGLLVGATVNMYPHLFKIAVADVPFVDALNTMSDPTIPLTVTEWEEWGNPNEEQYYNYMEKYSPYDNIQSQNYPAILVTAGLNDPRVAYWEPAKFVAKLREYKTDNNILLLKTDMGSGHFSASDRYKYIKETAFEYSVILDQILLKK